MEFTKQLSASEAKYKYMGLTKKLREEFPEKDIPFKMKFKNKSYSMKVNNKNCIMLTQLYEIYQFKENDQIRLVTKNGIDFELSVTS